jgi:molybdopterin synthase catalytic subunit
VTADVRRADEVVQRVGLVGVSDQPLDVAAHEASAAHPAAGAVVTFCGVVRDHDHGRTVTRLSYEGHPSAAVVLRRLAEQVAARPEVLGVAVSHRVGDLRVGEVAIVACVASAHRGAAFAICGQLVDDAKAQLPIWKHQVFADGSDEWVNCP